MLPHHKINHERPEGHDKELKVSTLAQHSPHPNLIASCLSRHRDLTPGGFTCVSLDYVLLFSFRMVPPDPPSLYKLGHLWIWLACQIKLGWRWRPVQPLDLYIVREGTFSCWGDHCHQGMWLPWGGLHYQKLCRLMDQCIHMNTGNPKFSLRMLECSVMIGVCLG